MDDHEQRDAAINRLTATRGFEPNDVADVAVHALLVVTWFVGGPRLVWPLVVMAGWAVGLATPGWQTCGATALTGAGVQRAMERREGDLVG